MYPALKSRASLARYWRAMAMWLVLVSLPGGAMAAPGQGPVPLSTGQKDIEVVGGKPVPKDVYPWQVALVSAGIPDHVAGVFCGGTLIESKWVLTAAHCFYDRITCQPYPKQRYYVAWGSTDLGKSVSLVAAAEIFIRDGYKCGKNGNDLGLIRLEASISASPTVRLASEQDRSQYAGAGQRLTTAGWGLTQVDGATSRLLLEVSVPVVDRDSCKAHYGAQLPEDGICAGETDKDACYGDSGGPLFYRKSANETIQIGIVSFGDGCGKRDVPSVYTDVLAHRSWITSTLAKHSCTPNDVAKGLC